MDSLTKSLSFDEYNAGTGSTEEQTVQTADEKGNEENITEFTLLPFLSCDPPGISSTISSEVHDQSECLGDDTRTAPTCTEEPGPEVDDSNLGDQVQADSEPTLRVHKQHPQNQIIGDPKTPVQTRRMVKQSQQLAQLSDQQATEEVTERLSELSLTVCLAAFYANSCFLS